MIKKIFALCATAGCLCFTTASAFAQDGAIGDAARGIVNAGEDAARGIARAGEDIINGVTGNTPDTNTNANPNTTVDPNTTTTPNTTPDTNTDATPNGEIINDSGVNAIGDTTDTTTTDPNNTNPTTGVATSYAGVTAALAAMGVALSSIRRKRS